MQHDFINFKKSYFLWEKHSIWTPVLKMFNLTRVYISGLA